MAWSISLSPEGWLLVSKACLTKSKQWLFAAVNEARRQTTQKPHTKKRYRLISQDELAEEAYQFIRQTNTCDNGGFKYWIDEEGYYKIEIE